MKKPALLIICSLVLWSVCFFMWTFRTGSVPGHSWGVLELPHVCAGGSAADAAIVAASWRWLPENASGLCVQSGTNVSVPLLLDLRSVWMLSHIRRFLSRLEPSNDATSLTNRMCEWPVEAQFLLPFVCELAPAWACDKMLHVSCSVLQSRSASSGQEVSEWLGGGAPSARDRLVTCRNGIQCRVSSGVVQIGAADGVIFDAFSLQDMRWASMEAIDAFLWPAVRLSRNQQWALDAEDESAEYYPIGEYGVQKTMRKRECVSDE